MKALLCTRFGPPSALALEDLPALEAGPGQVVVTVHAAAANFPDTLIIENKYQHKPALPFSPGGEIAGVVRAVGPGVSAYAPGDRVIAVCGWGGFAEEVVTDAANLIPLPDGIAFDAAAALVIAYGTTHYALQERGALQPGETLLVLGAAGGTGLAAVELGKLMGARVIAAASSPEKLTLCRQHGADETIDYARTDLREELRRLSGGRGVDVVYDPVGGDYTEMALRGMAWGGRLLVIGFTAGQIPRPPLNLPLLKGCSIVGVYWGGMREHDPARCAALMRELLDWVRAGRVKPAISARYPLEQAVRALEELAARRVTGKVVITTTAGRAAGLA